MKIPFTLEEMDLPDLGADHDIPPGSVLSGGIVIIQWMQPGETKPHTWWAAPEYQITPLSVGLLELVLFDIKKQWSEIE